MPRLRIAYIANVRMPTEKAHGYQIMKMCEALAESGASVELFFPRRRQTNPDIPSTEDPFAYYGVARIFTVRRLRNWDVVRIERFVPAAVFRFLFYCHSAVWGACALFVACRKADAVYLRDDVPIAAIAALLGIPFAYEVHRIPAGFGQYALRFLRGRSLRCAAALTEHVRRRLIGEFGFDPAKTVALPDGVDTRLFEGGRTKDIVRQEAGLPADALLVGYVGTFTALGYEKGIGCLVRAMADVRIPYPAALLVCVGGPESRIPQYRAVAADAGIAAAVHFIGRVSPRAAAEWMRACDVLVIPLPYNEFFAFHTSPLKLFEYMASGVPIVVTDLPSLREVVSEETSLFAESGSPASLAAGIVATFGDRAAAEGRARQARVSAAAYAWHARAKTALKYFMMQ